MRKAQGIRSVFAKTGCSTPHVAVSSLEAKNARHDLERYEQAHGIGGDRRFKLHLLLPWAAWTLGVVEEVLYEQIELRALI